MINTDKKQIYTDKQQKTRLSASSLTVVHASAVKPDLSNANSINVFNQNVNRNVNKSVEVRGVEPLQPDLTDPAPHRRTPTLFLLLQIFIIFAISFAILILPGSVFATNSGIFSLELWVKPTSSIASQALVGKAEEMRMFTDASGNPGCQIKTTTWQTAVTSSTAITLNKWNFVACTYDKANIKIYLNGVQTGTQALTTIPDDTAAAFEIGEDDSSSTPYSNLTGVVDGFEFYNYALSSKQVVSDMNAGGPAVGAGSSRPAPVAYWKFDEGQGTVANNSGNGGTTLNGTLTQMASPATATSGWTNSGKFGKGLIFDGSDDYVVVTHSNPINFDGNTDSYTISFWLKTNNTNNNAYYIHKWAGSGVANMYPFKFESGTGANGNIVFAVYNGSSNPNITSTKIINDNVWHYITGAVSKADSKLYLYVDGISQGSVNNTVTSTTANTADIRLMRSYSTTYTAGSIDEVKIYNYALTADEVKIEYNRGSALSLGTLGNLSSLSNQAAGQQYCVPGDTTSCAAPVGEWNFEEGKDNTCSGGVNDVCDTSGNANNGAISGATWTTGKVGKALKFVSANNNRVSVNSSSTLSIGSTQDFTIEAWVKTTVNTAWQTVAGFSRNNELYLSSKSLNFYPVASSNSIANLLDGNWHHVVLVRSSNNIYYYSDGVNVTPSALTDNRSWSSPGFEIGGDTNAGESMTGSIDNVRFFNYARTPAQIAWDYNRGAPVGHWKMDECQGSIINDSSGNKNTGTITIGASGEDTVGTCNTSSTAWGSGASGKRNASLSFDGTDDYVDISSFTFNDNSIYSVSFWFYPQSSSSLQYLVDLRSADSAGQAATIAFNHNSNSEIDYVIYGDATWKDGSKSLSLNQWYHIVAIHDSVSNNVKTYINGLKDVDTTVNDYTVSASPIRIGARRLTAASPTNGQIDDVRIYNYALTATQVKDLYNNGAVNFGPSTGSP